MANTTAAASHSAREHSQVTTSTSGSSPASSLEFAETTTITLEWTLSGLRQMYDNSKGEAKSKCVKSAVFGDPDNLWEVLWYPNSGVTGGEFSSLYLSCLPTNQEKEQAIGGKWARKGSWQFRFEVKVQEERSKNFTLIASKEASDHSFAFKTANWGWQQFAKRDTLFLDRNVVAQDWFVVVCTITAQPQPPAGFWLGINAPSIRGTASDPAAGIGPAWAGGDGACIGIAGGTRAAGGPKRLVPRDLISGVGEMLDDPLYSDIEFVIPSPPLGDLFSERPPARLIYANKKLLNRCEYFEAMFNGGFSEVAGISADEPMDDDDTLDMLSDSDEEDEAEDLRDGGLLHTRSPPHADPATRRTDSTADLLHKAEHSEDEDEKMIPDTTDGAERDAEGHASGEPVAAAASVQPVALRTRARSVGYPALGPKRTRVVVRDAAWSTWWAVLYWMYTDTIYFAPLRSSFTTRPTHTRQGSTASSIGVSDPKNRREWIAQWLTERGMGSGAEDVILGPGAPAVTSQPAVGPRPVSAKSVYRLADKLDLPALKLRAYQHICGQLTSHNIPAEVFSRFSSTFEDVRKVQVAFFLKHWSEIKKSDTMQNIWKQIRDGKHVGFEEVWPLIVSQLDFRPS